MKGVPTQLSASTTSCILLGATYNVSISHSICDNGDGQGCSVVQVGPSFTLFQHSGHDKKSTLHYTERLDPPSF